MPAFPLKQPNGTYARFSTVVDDFTAMNLTRSEMKATLMREVGANEAARALARADKDVLPRVPFDRVERTDGLGRWYDALHTLEVLEKKKERAAAIKEDANHKPLPEPELRAKGSWCPECGPNVMVDEDGLCAGCGSTAMGPGADAALTALKAYKTLKRKTHKLLKDDYSALEYLEILTTRDKEPVPEGEPGDE